MIKDFWYLYNISNGFTYSIFADILGIASKDRMRARAMKFLHKMDYNYIKAKFYILFPYYLKYNSFRCHDPLNISIEDMKKKINDHIEGLRNTKQKQMERWVQNIQNCLENGTTYTKISTIIDSGKLNKYQVPEHIKQQIEKALKAGKQLKKSVQGTKVPLNILTEKKKMLLQHKIQTSQMINFQDTVSRCQQWLVKQRSFMQRYIRIVSYQPILFQLIESDQKIEFKAIQLLVSQYNSLPVLDTVFQNTIKSLYTQTVKLLDRMPTLNKTVKTRTTKEQIISKIPYSVIRQYLSCIQKYPIIHEDFITFQINMRESLQLLERLSMFLQDSLSQKTSRILNHYIKLMSDIQIENQIQKKLKMRLQYNDIMERIKKQLSNPGKVDSIKQALNKLKEKGIKQVEDTGYQQKIMLYLGWYESQQKLKDNKTEPTNIQLIQKQLQIKKKLVHAQNFKDQLQSARKQLNISEQSLEEAHLKIQKWKENQIIISQMLGDNNPNLQRMIQLLKICITQGLTFPQFQQLYEQVIKYFSILAKIHYLLKYRNDSLPFLEPHDQQNLFFSQRQCDYIIELIVFQSEIKDLRSKQGAYKLLQKINQQPFPVYLREHELFNNFMSQGEEWEKNILQKIKDFRQKGESIDPCYLQTSKYHVHFKSIIDELNRIQFVMRWRDKISKKFDDNKPVIFTKQNQAFLQKLENDLKNYQSMVPTPISGSSSSPFKFYFLEYNRENQTQIKQILSHIINDTTIQNKCKLAEMNKFYRQIQKQIQRHKIEDKRIFELKQQFKQQIAIADDWKQRYLMIKRFEKKKIIKKQNNNAEENNHNIIDQENQENSKNGLFGHSNQITPDHTHVKKKYSIKNNQFTWYFKFLIMLLEFCKGYKLRFCLQEIDKLKSSLSQIYKFISNYDKLIKRSDPSDIQLAHLETQFVKIPIFIRQYWLLNRKNAYVQSWRILADSILESVPIVNMQFKARKQSQLIALLAKKKIQTQEANKQVNEENQQSYTHKRSRKPNKLYTNDDITLLTDQNMLGPKTKKRRKGQNTSMNDTEYRNTSVSKKSQKEQLIQIERAQQLLKNTQIMMPNLLFDEEAIKQYCICRNGQLNQNSTMVQCQGKCGQWYHIQCIGIKKHQTKGDYHYVCIGCTTLYQNDQQLKNKQQGSFYWDYHKKITEYAFIQIVQEGRNLGIQTQQLRKLLVVEDKMNEWKKKVNDILETITRDEFKGKPIQQHSDRLYQIYLLSIWLPTLHPQTYIIKKLLMLSKGIIN